MAVSSSPNVILSTYALGSCVGVLGYDPKAKVAGLIHIMLPRAGNRMGKSGISPHMFVDTGMPLLLEELLGVRAMRSRLLFAMLGGAAVNAARDYFKIGADNIVAVRNYLTKAGCRLAYEDVGGAVNRTVHFHPADGILTVKKPHEVDEIQLG